MLAQSEKNRDDQISKPNGTNPGTAHSDKQNGHPRQGSPKGYEKNSLSMAHGGELSSEGASRMSKKMSFDESHRELKRGRLSS